MLASAREQDDSEIREVARKELDGDARSGTMSEETGIPPRTAGPSRGRRVAIAIAILLGLAGLMTTPGRILVYQVCLEIDPKSLEPWAVRGLVQLSDDGIPTLWAYSQADPAIPARNRVAPLGVVWIAPPALPQTEVRRALGFLSAPWQDKEAAYFQVSVDKSDALSKRRWDSLFMGLGSPDPDIRAFCISILHIRASDSSLSNDEGANLSPLPAETRSYWRETVLAAARKEQDPKVIRQWIDVLRGEGYQVIPELLDLLPRCPIDEVRLEIVLEIEMVIERLKATKNKEALNTLGEGRAVEFLCRAEGFPNWTVGFGRRGYNLFDPFSPSSRTRRSLALLGPHAKVGLTRALRSSDPDVLRGAVQILVHRDRPDIYLRLPTRLTDKAKDKPPSPELITALLALNPRGNIGPWASQLTKALASEDLYAKALAVLADVCVLPTDDWPGLRTAMTSALGHHRPEVRVQAITFFSNLWPKKSGRDADLIAPLLRDSDLEVRSRALLCLVKLKGIDGLELRCKDWRALLRQALGHPKRTIWKEAFKIACGLGKPTRPLLAAALPLIKAENWKGSYAVGQKKGLEHENRALTWLLQLEEGIALLKAARDHEDPEIREVARAAFQ